MLGASSAGVSMGGSTAMTIEFLRARLLSERSVSRTARQRAEQLAKRVGELEEQLRIMVIQRKKAEKAASQVVSILENQEGDTTEVIDSSSDQEDDDGKLKQSDVKENEISNASEEDKGEDGLSGSEPDVSPSQGRSLSWKGRISPDSHEMQKIKYRQSQRASSLTSFVEPSDKHLSGKSCRKIKRKEPRSATENGLNNLMLDEHGEGSASCSQNSDEQPRSPDEAHNNEMKEMSHASLSCSCDDQCKENGENLYTNRRDRYEEMERVLEQQAQLIGQFQAEENAQREWEEKYNKNKTSTMDDGTEINGEHEASMELTSKKTTCDVEDAKPSTKDLPNTEKLSTQCSPNVSFPTAQTPDFIESGSSNDVTVAGLANVSVVPNLAGSNGGNSEACTAGHDGMLSHQHSSRLIRDTGSQEFAFPAQEPVHTRASSNQRQQMLLGNTDNGCHINSTSHTNGNGIRRSSSSGSPSSVNSGNKFSNCQSPDMQSEFQRLQPESPSKRLGVVLQALQQAKASLGQLSGLPVPNSGGLAPMIPSDSHVRVMNYTSDLEIPIVPTGLFRLPTDSYPQTTSSMPKVYGSGLSLTSAYPDVGYGIPRSEYPYPIAAHTESRLRASVGRQYFDPYITSVPRMPLSTRHTLPYSHSVAERAPFEDGYTRPGIDLRNESSAGDRYNIYTADIRRL